MVLQDEYCEKCGEKYTNINYKWCKPCQIDCLKINFINWTSGNEVIDNFIQEMRLKINNPYDIIFEWIPYNQFNKITEIGKGGFSAVFSAIWKDGPLSYHNKKLKRISAYKKVALKCLSNSQDITNEFLKEVKNLFYQCNNIFSSIDN